MKELKTLQIKLLDAIMKKQMKTNSSPESFARSVIDMCNKYSISLFTVSQYLDTNEYYSLENYYKNNKEVNHERRMSKI